MTDHTTSDRVVRVQRCCNGCAKPLRDATEYECRCAIAGHRLPDVRPECPTCKGTTNA